MKKKYLQLCPWHFDKGRTFDNELFNDFRMKEQRWDDSLWLYVWYITIFIGMILVASIVLPRRRKAVKAMNLLGITNPDVGAALEHLKNGTCAYKPSDEEREMWLKYLKLNELRIQETKRLNKPKVMKIWGIILLVMCVVYCINTLTGNVEVREGDSIIPRLVAGVLMFGGGGAWLLIASIKAKKLLEADNDTVAYCNSCGKQLDHGATFCPKCGAQQK